MAETFKELLGDAYHDGMSEAEIINALQEANKGQNKGKEDQDDNKSGKLKELLSKANSEAAEWKKKYNSTLSEQQRAEEERKEEYEKLVNRNKDLEKQIKVSNNKAMLIGIGYSEDMAEKTAEAMFSGNSDEVINLQKSFMEEYRKSIEADMLKKTPEPRKGADGLVVTKEQFEKMSMPERMELYRKNPDLYEKLK